LIEIELLFSDFPIVFRFRPNFQGGKRLFSLFADARANRLTCASFHTAWKCVVCRYHQPVTVLLHCMPRCLRSTALLPLPQASLQNHSIYKKTH